jgi:hypothetical protein
MSLLDFFVVCGPPVSDTVKAEGVETVLKDSKSFAVGEHGLQAYYALLIADHALAMLVDLGGSIPFNIPAHAILEPFGPHGLRMSILTAVTISAIALLEILTNSPIGIVFEEVVNDIIIVLQVLWHLVINLNPVLGAIRRDHRLCPIFVVLLLILFLDLVRQITDQAHVLLVHIWVQRQLIQHVREHVWVLL